MRRGNGNCSGDPGRGQLIRSECGEGADSIAERERAPEDVTTSSWQALKLFGVAESLKMADRGEDAIGILKQAVQFDPEFTLAYMRIGDIRLGQGNYDEGEQWWAKAVGILGRRRLSEREDFRIKAMLAGDSTQYAECERIYRAYVVRFPNDWYAHWRHGSVLDHFDSSKEAAEELKTADRLRPNTWRIHAQLCATYLANSDFGSAMSAAQTLRKLKQPEWAKLYEAPCALLRETSRRRSGYTWNFTGPRQHNVWP